MGIFGSGVPTGGISGRVLSNKNIETFYVIKIFICAT